MEILFAVHLPKSLVTGRQLIKVGPSIELKGHRSYETLRLGLGSGLLFVMKFRRFEVERVCSLVYLSLSHPNGREINKQT